MTPTSKRNILILVEDNKKIVIITDETAPIQKLAETIAAIIGDYPGYSAAVLQAHNFSGENLLPAHAFFLGCEESKPLSFFYIEALLGHINMAGRPCGLFSSSAKTGKYLSLLVRDSESAAGKPFLAKGGAADRKKLQAWVQGILRR